ncbi:4162_t:CDS:2 [Acaulospora morrowiae]|uniref:4162_t:CDS:1 n=1 Tax=Acaulospora morrowiae TaxID=94023 RepID=A0A9N9NEM3_9GLOM|nr:4162_t:CDS:2 [Acaulospora morrowiae]
MGKRSPTLLIKIPENKFFLNHMSKKSNIGLLLGNSPLDSPVSEEAFEKELDRSRNEFNQFNKDLDELAHSMKKLFEDAPELLASIEEIKRKQGKSKLFIDYMIGTGENNVEECIMATQEKIIENEHRLGKLQSLQKEVHEEINNDLKKIQEQIYEASNFSTYIQTRTTEQLDYMLQAIHEYARLIEEASLTIKHFGDVGSPIKYESLDLSPFRQHEGSISYFDDHIYHSARAITPDESSPSTESQESPSVSTSTTHSAATTPTNN